MVSLAAVDVNSGIEDAAGAKDGQRAKALVQICSSWSQLRMTP
jgi:phosphoribosylanthranilate isomerase